MLKTCAAQGSVIGFATARAANRTEVEFFGKFGQLKIGITKMRRD
jgi:hypothetical protein